MATDRIELAIRAALASPKQGLAYVRALRRNAYMATMSTPELFALREILIRESSKPKAARTLTSREREIFGALEDRRAAGELENGGKNLVDLEALRHFARVSGFPSPGRYYLYLPDFDELVAADLLWRYGWTASEAGLAFDQWEAEHQREMSEIFEQRIRPLANVRHSAEPSIAASEDPRRRTGNPFAEDLQPHSRRSAAAPWARHSEKSGKS